MPKNFPPRDFSPSPFASAIQGVYARDCIWIVVKSDVHVAVRSYRHAIHPRRKQCVSVRLHKAIQAFKTLFPAVHGKTSKALALPRYGEEFKRSVVRRIAQTCDQISFLHYPFSDSVIAQKKAVPQAAMLLKTRYVMLNTVLKNCSSSATRQKPVLSPAFHSRRHSGRLHASRLLPACRSPRNARRGKRSRTANLFNSRRPLRTHCPSMLPRLTFACRPLIVRRRAANADRLPPGFDAPSLYSCNRHSCAFHLQSVSANSENSAVNDESSGLHAYIPNGISPSAATRRQIRIWRQSRPFSEHSIRKSLSLRLSR